MISLWLTALYAALVSASSGCHTGAPEITWGNCTGALAVPGIQCGTYLVPLNWDSPKGEQITLGMAKLPVLDPAKRIGNLFINPGGPGYSSAQWVGDIALGQRGYFGDELRTHFDVIGLDPRGGGISTPVLCDIDLWNERVSLYPTDKESYQAMVSHWRAVGESCRNMTGPLMDHIDTINVARDLEAVRVALGNEKLNWLGLSYGTLIGAQYAELYPGNFRSMVLDGVLQHSQDESSMLLAESTTYDATLREFFQWCGAANSSCALAGRDVAKVWENLLDEAERKPIPAPTCGTRCRADVNAEEIRFGAQVLLFDSSTWDSLAWALLNATQGDASALSTQLAVGDSSDSVLINLLATACVDWNSKSASIADIQEKHVQANSFAPYSQGASMTYYLQTACIGWEHSVTNPPKPLEIIGSPMILLVNSRYDPSTSYTWAMGVEREIGESARLLTRDGAGHTSYYTGGETSRATDAYLVNLTLPDRGTVFKT
ncbi:Alpha/Beta hydrolase protein [Dactylonectria estremocensis]|uniref:Alpha/Beta hydrolase protein n=1 Tax=Dactylonectria estremocensis TaxID=1079267 RepID=A0A9P9EJ02_9HYPO|nr:Alpha/Beta hydrolase protein [Dactylonectria estremocensis]